MLNLGNTLTKIEVHLCELLCNNFIKVNEFIVDFIPMKWVWISYRYSWYTSENGYRVHKEISHDLAKSLVLIETESCTSMSR